ncbi:hypothetical protein [Streptococcus thoraltensis]
MFNKVLNQAWIAGLFDPSEICGDGTQIKAAANNHKYRKELGAQQAKFMSDQLELELDCDRKKHAKNSPQPFLKGEAKENKISTPHPKRGGLHKGDQQEGLSCSGSF